MKVVCEISLGELIDKISILRIKQQKIKDTVKQKLAAQEEQVLNQTLAALNVKDIEQYLQKLQVVNEKLWDIEDDIRDHERNKQFDAQFVELARSVYKTNDQRFAIKNEINTRFNSSLKEVKSYQSY